MGIDPFSVFPPAAIAGIIFFSRIADVSLGTMRTLSVVHGRIWLAMVLGFFEVTFWVAAITQVLAHLGDAPYFILFYAGGFAAGNATGILLERRMALGSTAIRMISERGAEVAQAIGGMGNILFTAHGSVGAGDGELIYATCPRRQLPAVVSAARSVDPSVFYVVERFAEMSRMTPLAPATGWRAVIKKK